MMYVRRLTNTLSNLKIIFPFMFKFLVSVLDYTMVLHLGLLSTKKTFVILSTTSEGCVVVAVLGH